MAVRPALLLALMIRNFFSFTFTTAGHRIRFYLERHRVNIFCFVCMHGGIRSAARTDALFAADHMHNCNFALIKFL